MRRFIAIVVLVLCVMAIETGVAADPLKFSVKILETAPLVPFSFPETFTYEATLVNVGPNSALGSILLCDAATGVCSPSSCSGIPLAPGHACSAGPYGADSPKWARMILIRFGDKKPIDGRGALEVRVPGADTSSAAIEAVSR